MLISNDIIVANVLKRGLELYKITLRKTYKYNLLTVILTSFISIYMFLLNLIGSYNEFLYSIGLIFLVMILIPVIYYSVRIVATTVGNLKSIIYCEDYNYREQFSKSKKVFWRIFLVLSLRMIMGIIISTMLLLVFTYSLKYRLFGLIITNVITLVFLLILFISLYLLFRLEFAAATIYWRIESIYSDIQLSFRLTKYHKIKKLIVVIIAHLPSVVLLMITMYLKMIYNDFITMPMLGFFNLLANIALSASIFSWMYSCYIALLEELGTFDKNPEDREWLRF